MDSSRTEDVESVRQALTRLMAIADRLESRNAQAVQRIDAAAVALDQGVNRLDAGGERFARGALQVIGSSVQQVVAQSAGQAVGELRQRLQQGADSVRAAAHAMDAQRKGLAAARRTLVWNGLVALLLGSLLAAGAATWVVHRSMQDLSQAHFGQDLLHATQRGAITRCGDSLCIKVGRKPRRFGKDGQYVLLEE
jgi:hypothetical protein